MAGSYRFEGFELDTQGRHLRGPAGRVQLRGQALQLLKLLVSRAPDLVGRDEILEHIWGHGERSDSAIPQAVREIRTALGDTAKEPRFIATRYGKGYQFLADVDLADRVEDPSIAVLPFANLSGDASQDYFSQGMSDELIGLLGRVPELRVIGRKSSFSFDQATRDLRAIGRALGATHVVDGSVRRSGDTVRISAELLSTIDGTQLWSETYDRQLNDILRVQNEIGRAVVARLRVQLLGDDLPMPATLPVADAYDLYLRGLRLHRYAGFESLREAEALMARAVELDPTLAAAWSSLAGVYWNQITAGMRAHDEGRALAKAASERAMATDPGLADAHYTLGFLSMTLDHAWHGAEAGFLRCLELKPSHVGGYTGLGLLHAALGHGTRAIEYARRSIELDPLLPPAHHNLGFVAYLAGNYELAEGAYHRALGLLDGAYNLGNARLSQLLLASGRPEEALAMASRDPSEQWRLAAESLALHALGQGGEAQLARLEAKFADRAATAIARIHAFRGATDPAFAWLQRSAAQRETELTYVLSDPLFAAVEDDPRWAALRRRLGLGV